MTEHKHAEILRAIADGKDVQCMYVNEINAEWHGNWLWDMLGDPRCIWRIKPTEPVKRWLWVYKFSDFDWELVNELLSDDEAAIRKANNPQNKYMKLSWSETEFEE